MTKVKRVAIFSIGASHQMSQTTGLKRGFEALGIEAYAGHSLLDGGAMTFFVDEYKPDLVIEINRSRNQIRECDSAFNHVSWIWDYNLGDMMLTEGFGGSLHNFFVINPGLTGHALDAVKPWSYLLPGVDADVFSPNHSEFESDFSIIGYLPDPISEQDRSTPINNNGQVVCTLDDLFDALDRSGLKQYQADHDKLKRVVAEVFQKADDNFGVHNIPPQLILHLEERWLRATDRIDFLEDILSVSKNVRFYGYGGWTQWSNFAPYYMGPVFSNSEKASIYCNTRITLHNGIGMHDRVLEAMSCGAAVMLNNSPLHDTEFGLYRYFERDIDFVQFEQEDSENIKSGARELLEKPSLVSRIGGSARQKILSAHTWKHRAAKMLEDLKSADFT